MSLETLPMVSVVTITYGHEMYIGDTLKGVLTQQYAGPVEFIIANDNSPDGTEAVIEDYFQQNPPPANFTVRYSRHPQNLGMMPNFIWALKQATGKYIALCEGDDYWTDPLKLQKQVDFLEKNPEYVIACHNVSFLNGSTLIHNNVFDKINIKSTYSLEDLSKRNFIPTLSVMFRNFEDLNFPSWYSSSIVGDYPLLLFLAQKGLIYYNSEKAAVYRQNVGIWSGWERKTAQLIQLYKNLMVEFQSQPLIVKNLKVQIEREMKLSLSNQSLVAIVKSPYWNLLPTIDKIKVLVKKL